MKRSAILAILAIAACGGSGSPDGCPDAGAACGSACSAAFSGNFNASSVGPQNCAQVTEGSDVVLGLSLAARGLDAPLAVSIDLGASPIVGVYSSETTADWSALGARTGTGGECIYSAGAQGVPMGSFQLSLARIDAGEVHGELSLVQYVQAQEGVDCGSGDTELVDARF